MRRCILAPSERERDLADDVAARYRENMRYKGVECCDGDATLDKYKNA